MASGLCAFRCCFSLGLIATGGLSAAEYTSFTNTTDDGLMALATAVLGDNPRITIIPGSIHFTGTTTVTAPATPSTSYARHFDLGSHGDSFYELSQDGVLFTTGDGTPPNGNTSTGYGVEQSLDIADPDLATLVGQETHDTTALEFDFTVDPGVVSLGFEFMFMSDEFPEYANSSFCDAAAIYVDGTNYAYYNNDPAKYLSVKSNLISSVNIFYDNQTGTMPIEYDGVTRPAGVLAPLDTSLTTHHARIAIADTGDQIYDSAILVADVFGSDRSIPSNQAGIVPLASPRLPSYTINTFEGAPKTTIPVYLSQPALEAVTVTYQITGNPVLGTDYSTSVVTATGTLSFAVGDFVKLVDITPLTDGVIDGDKSMTFRLTDATKAIPLRGKAVTINIYDMDGAPAPTTETGPGNPGASHWIDGKEQGNSRCGTGTGLALMAGSVALMALSQRRRR